MTIEEKAKAYDEALERARELRDKALAYNANHLVKDYETIFHELRESEDERIRKLLIWQVHRNIEDDTNDLAQSVYDGIKGHDPDLEESIEDWKKCLAWLEKQKEQKPAEKQDYSGLTDLERAIHRGFLSAGVENVPVIIIKETAQECLAQMKPAEWSEEDERNRDRAIFYTRFYQRNEGTTKGSEECIDWLKSLRPVSKESLQPHWKPSEEQMSILRAVKEHVGRGSRYWGEGLGSLIKDLEKLM